MSRTQRAPSRMRQSGYTLIDVMIVTVIMSVLSSVAITSYQSYVARAKRPEAVMTFRALAAAQREHLVTRGKYAGTFDALGFRVEGGKRISPTEIEGRRYTFRLIQDEGPRSWYCLASGDIDGDPFRDMIAASNPR